MSTPTWKIPAWLEDGIYAVQQVEGHVHGSVQRRKGFSTLESTKMAQRESSQETVDRLSQLGINLAIIDFYSGSGLENEKENAKKAKEFAEFLLVSDAKNVAGV